MKDFDIIYKGQIIANIKAATLKEATKNAKLIWGNNIVVEPT